MRAKFALQLYIGEEEGAFHVFLKFETIFKAWADILLSVERGGGFTFFCILSLFVEVV